jgi:hypothetical protein
LISKIVKKYKKIHLLKRFTTRSEKENHTFDKIENDFCDINNFDLLVDKGYIVLPYIKENHKYGWSFKGLIDNSICIIQSRSKTQINRVEELLDMSNVKVIHIEKMQDFEKDFDSVLSKVCNEIEEFLFTGEKK